MTGAGRRVREQKSETESGASIVSVVRLGERLLDVEIDSVALQRRAMVRVLLPRRFEREPERRWPVLLLLHGAVEPESYRSWTVYTDVEELTAPLDILTVMPEGGWNGFYTDWWNGGEGGPPRWETFHIREVLPLIERRFRAGGGHAIAGLSMGGLGAMSYAERHPALFLAAASFSGVLDPLQFDETHDIIVPEIWGDRTANAGIWRAHDPADGVAALKGRHVYVSCGNGIPGPLDGVSAQFDQLERTLETMNEEFVRRATAAGVAVTANLYGPGTHAWPYWQRGLHEAMPMLMAALEHQE